MILCCYNDCSLVSHDLAEVFLFRIGSIYVRFFYFFEIAEFIKSQAVDVAGTIFSYLPGDRYQVFLAWTYVNGGSNVHLHNFHLLYPQAVHSKFSTNYEYKSNLRLKLWTESPIIKWGIYKHTKVKIPVFLFIWVQDIFQEGIWANLLTNVYFQ